MNIDPAPAASLAVHPAWLIIAWGAMLAVVLPDVILGRATDQPPPWLIWPASGLLVGLIVLTSVWSLLHPLRGYILTLLALVCGRGLSFLLLQSAPYRAWLQTANWGVAFLASMLVWLIPTALVALTLIGSGLGRQDLFLVPGNLHAPVQPNPIFSAGTPWSRTAQQFVMVGSIVMFFMFGQGSRPDLRLGTVVLVNLPLIILAAAINAGYGEFCFRAVLLGRLVPVLGPQQALWLSAVCYSLWNYHRMPSRYVGALLNGFLGWFLGKSMLETGGVALAFLVHFGLDVVIFTLVAFEMARHESGSGK
jgi:uncharacterized protein